MQAEVQPARAGQKRGRGRRLVRWGSVAVMAGTLLATLAAAPSQAASVYRVIAESYPSGRDAGGYDIELILERPDYSGFEYVARFYAYGERLHLYDGHADGHAAKAIVKVYNKSGVHVDTDTFYTTQDSPTSRDINMGTPDGSGNIPEGYAVRVQLCINETSICTPVRAGRA